LFKFYRSAVEKKIGEIADGDQLVRIDALVIRTNPFIIGDGSGEAKVNAACGFHEGDRIRIIGSVSRKEDKLSEINPVIVRDMSRIDYDLYNELQEIKSRLVIQGRSGGELI
jgi:hypothetical protein